jgi:hypothetical protein
MKIVKVVLLTNKCLKNISTRNLSSELREKLRKQKHLFLLSHRMPSDNAHDKYLIAVKTEITYAYFLAQVKEKRKLFTHRVSESYIHKKPFS